MVISDINLATLSTAMTNSVFLVECTALNVFPSKLLLRVYRKSAWMFDRKLEESTNIVLSNEGIIPKVLGIFGNGRFEEFIVSDSVLAADYCNIEAASDISSQLANIHSLLPKLVEFAGWKSVNYAWMRLEQWRETAVVALRELSGRQTVNREIIELVEQWNVLDSDLSRRLKEYIENAVNSPLIFGHCDVQMFENACIYLL